MSSTLLKTADQYASSKLDKIYKLLPFCSCAVVPWPEMRQIYCNISTLWCHTFKLHVLTKFWKLIPGWRRHELPWKKCWNRDIGKNTNFKHCINWLKQQRAKSRFYLGDDTFPRLSNQQNFMKIKLSGETP